MHRRRWAVVVTVLALVGLTAPGAAAQGRPSATPPPPPAAAANATGWYLALGDSLAAGYQPGQGDDKTGGYVGGVLDAVRTSTPKTRLVNVACSGETVVTMVVGGRCAYDEGTQLAQAVEFLHAHSRTTRLVTIDIGANDVQRCVSRRWPSCTPPRPGPRIVVASCYNPSWRPTSRARPARRSVCSRSVCRPTSTRTSPQPPPRSAPRSPTSRRRSAAPTAPR
jgi:hypothetical protein